MNLSETISNQLSNLLAESIGIELSDLNDNSIRIASKIQKRYGLIGESSYLSKRILGSGEESNVYLSEDGKKVIKFMFCDVVYGNSLLKAIDCIALFNTLFPESAYEVFGFSYDEKRGLAVVVEQPFFAGETVFAHFNGSIPLGYRYIMDCFKEFGFKWFYDKNVLQKLYLNKYAINVEHAPVFVKAGCIVSDVHLKNIIISKDERPHVIDCYVCKISRTQWLECSIK